MQRKRKMWTKTKCLRRGLPGARAFVHAVERPHAVTRPVLVVQTRLPAACEAENVKRLRECVAGRPC